MSIVQKLLIVGLVYKLELNTDLLNSKQYMSDIELMKYKVAKNKLLWSIGILIVGLAGFYIFRNSYLYTKAIGLRDVYHSKSEKQNAEELEQSYKRDIEGDVFYITTLLLTDSLDNPGSLVMLKREITFTELKGKMISGTKDPYIKFYVFYRYKDLSGKRIFGSKSMIFDKNLNFIGVEK